jgi:hypothetical protein
MQMIGQITVGAISFVTLRVPPDPFFILRSPLLWGLSGLFVGDWLFFRGFPFLKRKRLIQNTPTSTVRGASLGAVEVSGTVVGPYTLVAPFSGADCFYYHAIARGNAGEEKQAREEILPSSWMMARDV